jgi:acetylornithine deacetylase/succinyl-diaminopimelate desuccinylase-like protein
MRRLSAALFLLLLTSSGCARPSGLFSEPNARAHIGMLAGTIGSRPVGTPSNARARLYIVEQLRLFGYEVRVQEADGRRPQLGRTARVSNIIAVRQGRRSEAVGLVSHYDSVAAGPGAGDNALGVGVSLEAARVLAAKTDPQWTVMILVTDGEEAGLMGAAALMTDRDVTKSTAGSRTIPISRFSNCTASQG